MTGLAAIREDDADAALAAFRRARADTLRLLDGLTPAQLADLQWLLGKLRAVPGAA